MKKNRDPARNRLGRKGFLFPVAFKRNRYYRNLKYEQGVPISELDLPINFPLQRKDRLTMSNARPVKITITPGKITITSLEDKV